MKLLAGALMLLLLAQAVSGQNRMRIIRSPECPYVADDDDGENFQLEVSGLNLAGNNISFDVPFEANDDWLARLTFRLVNTTRKPIAGILIRVGLLAGLDEELAANASYDYGLQFIRLNEVTTRRSRSKPRLLVAPGKETEITARGARPFGLQYMDAILAGKTRTNRWLQFVRQSGGRFHKAEVIGAEILFTDGTNVGAELLVKGKCEKRK